MKQRSSLVNPTVEARLRFIRTTTTRLHRQTKSDAINKNKVKITREHIQTAHVMHLTTEEPQTPKNVTFWRTKVKLNAPMFKNQAEGGCV